MKNAAQATKDAATALVRLPGTRVIEVHERCHVRRNGAPDCRDGGDQCLPEQGLQRRAAGRCSHVAEMSAPASWLSGRTPAAGECPEETVVLRAVCQ